MPSAWNTASKEAVNWPARSLIRNLTGVPRSTRSIRKLRAAWVVHTPSQVRGDAGQVHAAGVMLDHDQGIETPQQHGVHVGKIGREDAAGLVSRGVPCDHLDRVWRRLSTGALLASGFVCGASVHTEPGVPGWLGISRAAWCPPCRSGAWAGYAADRVAGIVPGRAGCNTSSPFPVPGPGGEAGRVPQVSDRDLCGGCRCRAPGGGGRAAALPAGRLWRCAAAVGERPCPQRPRARLPGLGAAGPGAVRGVPAHAGAAARVLRSAAVLQRRCHRRGAAGRGRRPGAPEGRRAAAGARGDGPGLAAERGPRRRLADRTSGHRRGRR